MHLYRDSWLEEVYKQCMEQLYFLQRTCAFVLLLLSSTASITKPISDISSRGDGKMRDRKPASMYTSCFLPNMCLFTDGISQGLNQQLHRVKCKSITTKLQALWQRGKSVKHSFSILSHRLNQIGILERYFIIIINETI